MADKPVAFHDLHPDQLPVTFEFLNQAGDVVHSIGPIDGPCVIEVPALHHEHGPISVRTTYGDGTIHLEGPP